MSKTKRVSKITKSHKRNGAPLLVGMFAATLLLMVGLSALVLKLLAPPPTVDPEIMKQSAASTLDVSVPIYVDETLNALLPEAISGTLTALAPTPISSKTPTINPTTTTLSSSNPVGSCGPAGFVADSTIPDGTQIQPSTAFTKVWIVRNMGTCTWAEDYALVFSEGELMAGKSPVTLGRKLNPGDAMEVSVNLVSPAADGVYISKWMLQNSAGETFGVNPDNQPLTLHILVGEDETRALDFTEEFDLAIWDPIDSGESGYPSPEETSTGSASPVETTVAEMGIVFDLPTIEVIPSDGADGNITGTYGLMQIQDNDRFNATIACANNQPQCNLLFELLYDLGDQQLVTLGQWTEITDGAHQKVSVNLSSLAGLDVQLILRVSSKNGTATDNKGLWISPVIFRTVN